MQVCSVGHAAALPPLPALHSIFRSQPTQPLTRERRKHATSFLLLLTLGDAPAFPPILPLSYPLGVGEMRSGVGFRR
jgi:hypothetical protein